MPDTKHVDYIIVGQGLAGSALAVQLITRNKKILVIDQPQKNRSSRVAAGLFNPITGKKMTKTWMADQLFPYLQNFYKKAEQLTDEMFFHPMPVYRPFLSVEEQNEWMAKSADSAFSGYLGKIFLASEIPDVKDPFGGLLLDRCGYVDTIQFMKAIRALIERNNLIITEDFDQQELIATQNSVEYKGFTASKIIFCQGTATAQNKWFDWVPVNALKGETLTLQSSKPPQQIINRGVYIVPSARNEIKIGSTYNYHDTEPQVTVKARKELEEKLNELTSFPYQVTGQDWGRRPTVPDRRPILGAHPEYHSLVIFNGLGTKGVSLAPYFSQILAGWLMGEIDLNKVIDVNRYKSLYSKLTK